MQNKQHDILTELKSIIETELGANVGYVGYFPDDIQKIGKKYPAILIGDGDETYELGTGTRVEYNYSIPMYIYHNVIIDRLEKMTEMQNWLIDAIEKDLTIDGNAVLVEVESVEKGSYEQDADKFNAGFYPNMTVRKVNFNVLVYDTRRL